MNHYNVTFGKGYPSTEQKARNESLVNDYNSHSFSTVELVKKYSITPQRIYKIIARAKKIGQG